ncbi:hypothetical protein, partial [Nereida sp. MMG025]|uniref:hypothetical protein n=1 Tax=Nereida sp. MMG025 TaxID=2909981 RepID=UPI001F32E05C
MAELVALGYCKPYHSERIDEWFFQALAQMAHKVSLVAMTSTASDISLLGANTAHAFLHPLPASLQLQSEQ